MAGVATPWMPLEGSEHAVALEVLRRGPLSRAALSRRTGLSQASLSRLTKPLVTSGLLVESGVSRSRTGRPSLLLDVVPTSHHFVGIKLTGGEAYAVATTLRAEVVLEETRPLADHSVPAVVETVRGIVERFSRALPHVDGLGVSLGGNVRGSSVVTRAPFLEWGEVPLAELLRGATGLPTVVENDITALSEAERWFGAGRTHRTFAVLTVGAGLGYGLVAHDRLVTNDDHGLGLVGHTTVDPTGPRCADGHPGCAHAMLSIPGIETAVSVAHQRPVGFAEIVRTGLDGEPVALGILTSAARGLGRLIGMTANFTLPEVVVVGGDGIDIARVAPEALEAGIRETRDPRAAAVKLEKRDGHFSEWARGAAVIAVQSFVAAG